jgi:hypothetical protein
MRRSNFYEFTGRAAKFSWKKVTIRRAVYDALKKLKRADVPKIVDAVLAQHPDLPTKQKDQGKQIQFTLWQFTREGLARERPDRRWREPIVATMRKRKVG